MAKICPLLLLMHCRKPLDFLVCKPALQNFHGVLGDAAQTQVLEGVLPAGIKGQHKPIKGCPLRCVVNCPVGGILVGNAVSGIEPSGDRLRFLVPSVRHVSDTCLCGFWVFCPGGNDKNSHRQESYASSSPPP